VLLQQAGRRASRPIPDVVARRVAAGVVDAVPGRSAHPRGLGGPDGYTRLAGPPSDPGRRHGGAAGRAGPAPAPGGVTPDPVPGRGGPATLRRRHPDRQDDAHAESPPERAPHGTRRPARVVGRASRTRYPGGDGAATELPQPVLGADRPPMSPGGPA